MLNASLLAFAGLLPLAASGHRLRRDAGAATPGRRAALRVVGLVLLLASLAASGAGVPGERYVRFLAAVSLAGIALILALSARAPLLLSPLRTLLERIGSFDQRATPR